MIKELDSYLDAVPRSGADSIDVGAFTLFVSHGPFPYYARPALTHPGPIVESDLVALEEACATHKVGMSIEWVHETHPELSGLTASYGLEVHSYALLVAAAEDIAVAEVDGVTLRIVNEEDSAIEHGYAVADVSFTFGGTTVGPAGTVERDAVIAGLDPALIRHMHERVRKGLTVTAVAETSDGVLAVGSYQPVDDLAEIVGVATLPTARQRGLAGAVTSLAARHALDNGIRMLLLSSQDENVARVYERIGFRRVGSVGAASYLR